MPRRQRIGVMLVVYGLVFIYLGNQASIAAGLFAAVPGGILITVGAILFTED